jgi:hypothetical protein
MATEKQIAANRANSKRSTGPKTAIGRLKSSRNAHKHGLSRALVNTTHVETFARTLASAGFYLVAAREVAEAELELARIRLVRNRMIALLFQRCHRGLLKRLMALDRYERSALSKRKRVGLQNEVESEKRSAL